MARVDETALTAKDTIWKRFFQLRDLKIRRPSTRTAHDTNRILDKSLWELLELLNEERWLRSERKAEAPDEWTERGQIIDRISESQVSNVESAAQARGESVPKTNCVLVRLNVSLLSSTTRQYAKLDLNMRGVEEECGNILQQGILQSEPLVKDCMLSGWLY